MNTEPVQRPVSSPSVQAPTGTDRTPPTVYGLMAQWPMKKTPSRLHPEQGASLLFVLISLAAALILAAFLLIGGRICVYIQPWLQFSVQVHDYRSAPAGYMSAQ